MKEKILRLCKRLNKFTLKEIATISEIQEFELLPILSEFQKLNKLIKIENSYIYNRIESELRIKLPQMFQYHSNQEIDYIIRGFCSDVEVKKMINVFGIGKNVMDKFYSYFRTVLYEKQKSELLEYFSKEPKQPQERKYMNTIVYLYLYNNKLFVSEKPIKTKSDKKHTEEERLMIKNIYLRSYRKVLSRSFAHKFHLHLAEELWKWGKEFNIQYLELSKILFS